MSIERSEPFGYHLILDMYDCDSSNLESVEDCYRYLDAVPDIIGTNKQSPPYVILTDAKKYPDKAGISGWIPVVESGISIHTIAPKKFVTIDIYSCKKFNPEQLKEFTFQFFKPKRIEENFFPRGKEFFKSNP